MSKKDKHDKAQDLRRRAEEKVRKRKRSEAEKLSAEDPHRLIHELEVHQIELEMQNDELRRSQVEIEESRSKYSDLYDFAPVGYFTFDEKGLILEVNLTGAELLHAERSALINKPFSSFVHKKYIDALYLYTRKVLKTKSRQSCELMLQLRPNSHKYIQLYVQMESIAAKDETGTLNVFRAAVSNITGRKLAEEKLDRAGKEWERTFDAVPDIIMLIDNQYRIKRANKALADRLGVTREELTGQFCYKVMHGTDEPPSYCPHSKVISEDAEHVSEIYEDYLKEHFIVSSTPVYDSEGNKAGVVEVFREITARKEMEEKLKVASITDVLTGLFNRRGFLTLAEQQWKLAGRSKRQMLLLYMDLDNMKEINDKLSHTSGDQALRDTADIIRKTFRESDVKGRMGGDEFAVLLTEPGSDAEQSIIKHFCDNLQAFNVQGERSYSLLISLGFAAYDPENPCSIEDLIKHADSAMYEDKKKKLENKVTTGSKGELKEKRTLERIDTGDACWAEIGDSDRTGIKNVSTGGVCLTNMHHLITGRLHSMKITCGSECASFEGIIVWSQLTNSEDYEAGLKFIGLTDGDRQSLAKIISSISK